MVGEDTGPREETVFGDGRCTSHGTKRDQSSSLGYLYIFPAFWLLGGIILVILFWFKKIRLQNFVDIILLFFSTPFPIWIVFFIFMVSQSSNLITSSYEYNKGGHRKREVKYQYQSRETQRIEFYTSKDTVTESNPFPQNDLWLKDSTWTYYKEDGTIDKVEEHSK